LSFLVREDAELDRLHRGLVDRARVVVRLDAREDEEARTDRRRRLARHAHRRARHALEKEDHAALRRRKTPRTSPTSGARTASAAPQNAEAPSTTAPSSQAARSGKLQAASYGSRRSPPTRRSAPIATLARTSRTHDTR